MGGPVVGTTHITYHTMRPPHDLIFSGAQMLLTALLLLTQVRWERNGGELFW